MVVTLTIEANRSHPAATAAAGGLDSVVGLGRRLHFDGGLLHLVCIENRQHLDVAEDDDRVKNC